MMKEMIINEKEIEELRSYLSGYEELLQKYSPQYLLERVTLPDGSSYPRWMVLKERASR